MDINYKEKSSNRYYFIAIWAVFTCIFVYFFIDAIAPFIISFLTAFFLQPLVIFFNRNFSFKKETANIIVFLLFIGVLFAALILLVPLIYNQLVLLANKIPTWRDYLQQIISTYSKQFSIIDPQISAKLGDIVNNIFNSVLSLMSQFANHIWGYTIATFHLLVMVIIIPFFLFYFLRDWDSIITTLKSLIPKKEKNLLEKILQEIYQILAAYIRGQMNICIIMFLYYVLCFSLIGVEFAIILGIFSGFFIIIPIAGAIISYVIVMMVSYLSYGWGMELIYVSAIFVIGHAVEGYILSPKIIGKSIGLHPLWIMFAAFSGASLYGLVGVFISLPVAGVIKVLLSYVIRCYKASNLYNYE